MAAQERKLPLSEEEIETVHSLVKRMLTETDGERFRGLVAQLGRTVERDPERNSERDPPARRLN